MKLALSTPEKRHHNGMVYSVCWNPLNNELLSIGDDKQLSSWKMSNDSAFDDRAGNIYIARKLMDLSHHCIGIEWCPDRSFMASAFVDGSLRIISFDKSSSSFKIHKTIDNAHHGAVTCLKWNSDGSALISGGEDGVIKQWSRSGNLRSKLLQSAHSIHSVAWSPDNQSIIYASDNFVGIQSIQGKNKKTTKWKAHSGIVLCLDCNPINKLLVTGGEDCYYRIWDEFGRLIYCSKVYNYPITSISWAPNGKYFGLGSYNLSLLCDYQGWTYQELHTNDGSALCMNWSQNSTHLSIGYANGQVLFGQITNQCVLYQNYNVKLNEFNKIIVQNLALSDFESVYETLEFNESVIHFSIRFDYLIAVTTKQCYIYQTESFASPQIIPLQQGTVIYVILQTPSFFILVNNQNGIHIIGYEGKTICQFNKSQTIKPKLLNAHNICCTNDTLAVIDVLEPKCIHLFDPLTSRTLSDSIQHSTNIIEIALNESITSNVRKIAFIDNNKDLFISRIHNESVFKLQTIVDSVAWHPDCDILLALSDKQLVIWYYPQIVWCDTDLLPHSIAKIAIDKIGNNAKIESIEGTMVSIKKQNGDEEIVSFSPLILAMYDVIREGKWNKALRLCHVCKDETLWCSLTGLAIDNGQIEIALQGLTALEEPDKILFLRSVQNMPLQATKDAELALYKKNIKSAENILIQNDLIYRVIELNMRLFRWQRALQLAVDHRSHIDTVIAFRSKFLEKTNKEESIELFIKYEGEVSVDWSIIEEKCRQEMDNEYKMAGIRKDEGASGDDDYWSLLADANNNNKKSKNGRAELEALLGISSSKHEYNDTIDID